MAVAAVFGGLAYLTDSVVPSMVVHGAGDALSALLAVAGAGTFGMPGAAEPKLRTPGASVMVVMNVVVLVATGLATAWAFRELAKAARGTKGETEAAVA